MGREGEKKVEGLGGKSRSLCSRTGGADGVDRSAQVRTGLVVSVVGLIVGVTVCASMPSSTSSSFRTLTSAQTAQTNPSRNPPRNTPRPPPPQRCPPQQLLAPEPRTVRLLFPRHLRLRIQEKRGLRHLDRRAREEEGSPMELVGAWLDAGMSGLPGCMRWM